jgi:hypothetical protein
MRGAGKFPNHGTWRMFMKKKTGVAFLIAAFVVLSVFTAFGSPSASWAQWDVTADALVDTELPISTVDKVIISLMNWLLGLLGAIALIAFVISGMQYLTAAGDEGLAERGKQNMKYSIIGVIVALSGYIILLTIDMFLSA